MDDSRLLKGSWLADVLDVGNDPLSSVVTVALIQLVCSVRSRNFSRVAEGGSCAAIFFHRSSHCRVEHCIQRAGLVLRTDGAVLDAPVGDEDSDRFGQVHPPRGQSTRRQMVRASLLPSAQSNPDVRHLAL